TATRPWTPAQLSSLAAALGKVAAGNPRDAGAAALERVEDAGFEAVAVTHLDPTFGIYVGTTTQVAKQHRARVAARLQAHLDKIVPAIRARMTAPDVPALLKTLPPIEPVVAAHPNKLPGAFHPWGPLRGSGLERM